MTRSRLISFLEAYLICGDILFDQRQLEEGLSNYRLAFALNSLSSHAVKGIVYCLLELNRPEEVVDFSKNLNLEKVDDPLALMGIYKAAQLTNKAAERKDDELEIQCMLFLDLAYKKAQEKVELLKDIAAAYFQLKKYQNVL